MSKNKNHTTINNKNIIQICSDIKKPLQKHHKENARFRSNQSPNISINHPSSTPIYNSFPNSTLLEDESRKVRFAQAMRDPRSTQSPYSIFDNGSSTFRREGNTDGYEQNPSPQINQDDYFEDPPIEQQQSFVQASQPQFRSESQNTSFFPRSMSSKHVRIAVSPSEQFTPMISRITHNSSLAGGGGGGGSVSSTGGSMDGGETFRTMGIDDFDDNETFDMPQDLKSLVLPPDSRPLVKVAGSITERFPARVKFHQPPPPPFNLPTRKTGNASIDEIAFDDFGNTDLLPHELENLNMGLRDMNMDDKTAKVERAERLEMKNRDKRSDAESTKIADEIRTTQLKKEQQIARATLAAELTRQQMIRMNFEDVKKKLQALIDTGESKVKKDSKLKDQIKELLKNKNFTEYTGRRNIGSMADAQTILNFLNDGSKKVTQKIAEIEESNKDDKETRKPPGGVANIRTLGTLDDEEGFTTVMSAKKKKRNKASQIPVAGGGASKSK